MTTKTKASKFRIRRSPLQASGPSRDAAARPLPQDGLRRDAPAPSLHRIPPAAERQRPPSADQPVESPLRLDAASHAPAEKPREQGPSATQASAEQQLDAIRNEGLTGRQLRMARRVAQQHGLSPTSDFDAVRQLRARGIDPFQRTNMLELVATGGNEMAEENIQLPQTVPAKRDHLPSPRVAPDPAAPALRRQQEIMDIQRDISRRRRRRSALLFTRLAFFVFLPTILAGYYYYKVATPMYASKSEFLILQADASAGSPLGGLLSGTQFATNQDSIAVQSYLQSKDAMLRLDQEAGFVAHFSQDFIDPIQKLPEDASTEQAYSVYKKNVEIGYDPTEGVIKMEVAAASPAAATNFSERLISYAEERVDELSRRKREDSMSTATASLARAKEERRQAQERLVSLQEGTFVDPEAIIASLRGQINNVEMQLQEKQLQLAALLNNARPNQARVDGTRADIGRLEDMAAELNHRMTDAQTGESSLAAKTAQIQMAQADLATADLFLQSALENEKQTELEANRQVRYLTTSVRPVQAQDPAYPRAFENTILVFLIMSGIYLMISLTSAILREQVSN